MNKKSFTSSKIKSSFSMSKISECIIFIYSDFKNNIKTHSNYSTLNEDGLTQHFVEILDNYLFSIGFPFGVKNQFCS